MASVDWPLPNRFKPLRAGFSFEAPNLIRRTSFEDGEDRVRRTANFRPHVYSAEFECAHAEYAILRRWIDEDIGGGVDWFNMNTWIDGVYRWVEARIVGSDGALFQLRLTASDRLAISLRYEVRELPRLDDCAYLAGLLGGQAEFDTWVSELDLAVNTDLKAATT